MCNHEHVRFEDGCYRVVCIDCDAAWTAVDNNGSPDFSKKYSLVDPFRATRHDRWVIPRTEKDRK